MAGPLLFILPPFQTKAACITISSTSTATTAVPLPLPTSGVPATQIRIVNEGPNISFLAISKIAQLATLPLATVTNTCDAVLSGEDLILTLAPGDAYISAICRAAQTATLTVYVGYGQ